jgi:chromosome segregation ATPase
MDSLDRLGYSLEQAVALIHSLRRENRELAALAASSAAAAIKKDELESLRSALDEAKIEIERLRQEPAPDIEAQERSRQAELEAASLAEQLEQERQRRQAEKKEFELKVHELELRTLAAEREETMPLPIQDRSADLERLQRRCAELELMLAESQAALEKAKGDFTSLQVRLAESADPGEVSDWQKRIHDLSTEVEGLRHLSGLKENLEAERTELRRQKRALAVIFKEREATWKKLEEIYAVLDNMRLS